MVELDFTALDWPSAPIKAAEFFHCKIAGQVREALDPDSDFWRGVGELPQELDGAVVFFPAADSSHDGWRLAAIQDLAREAAPRRVNGVAGCTDDEREEVVEYLRAAPGVTGQMLTVDGNSRERG